MKMFLQGRWVDKDEKVDVINPFDQSVVDTVPRADAGDVAAAIDGAVEGARIMRDTPGYERFVILRRAAELMQERLEDLAQTISSEEGKTLAEARGETSRAVQTFEFSAEEAKRLGSEVVPLDGAPGCAKHFGFTIRIPCGVVAAITPFNFPLNLVAHKVGPRPGRRQLGGAQAGQRHAAGLAQADRDPAGGRAAAAGHLLRYRTRRRDRRRHLHRPASTQNHLHRQPRRRRTHRANGRHEEGHHGTGRQQPAGRGRRRRTAAGGRAGGPDRVRQRRSGLHLRAASNRDGCRLR